MSPDILNLLKTYKKPLIIASVTVIFLILLISIIISLSDKCWLPLKNENLLSASPSSEINRFKKYLEYELTHHNHTNITDATIRENSVNTTQKDLSSTSSGALTQYTSTFLIDIDSIKQTYSANITWYSKSLDYLGDNVSVSCAKISDSRYPDSECETSLNNSHSLNLWLPHATTLKSSEKLIVKDITSDKRGSVVQIYLYSCNQKNPPIEATEKLVKNWVKDTVKDPKVEEYVYNVRPGYCENDPIY